MTMNGIQLVDGWDDFEVRIDCPNLRRPSGSTLAFIVV